MSEEKKKTYRLFKVSAELNVASDTLAEALQTKGYDSVDSGDPNAKISAEMYDFLVNKYASDKQSKEKASRQKLAQKEQAAERIRKVPPLALDEIEASDGAPVSALELRQRMNQQVQDIAPPEIPEVPEKALRETETHGSAQEESAPRNLAPIDEPPTTKPKTKPTTEPDSDKNDPIAIQDKVADRPKNSAATELELPPLPDFVSKIVNKKADPAPVAPVDPLPPVQETSPEAKQPEQPHTPEAREPSETQAAPQEQHIDSPHQPVENVPVQPEAPKNQEATQPQQPKTVEHVAAEKAEPPVQEIVEALPTQAEKQPEEPKSIVAEQKQAADQVQAVAPETELRQTQPEAQSGQAEAPQSQTPQPRAEQKITAETPAAQTKATEAKETKAPEAPKVELHSDKQTLGGLKVVGKVDLDQMDRRKRKPATPTPQAKGKPANDPGNKSTDRSQNRNNDPKKASTTPVGGGRNDRNDRNTRPDNRKPGVGKPVRNEGQKPTPDTATRGSAQPPQKPVKEEIKQPVAEIQPKPVEIITEEEQAVIRASENAPKLTGLTIKGKIELSADMVGRRSMRSGDKGRPGAVKTGPGAASTTPPAPGSAAAAAEDAKRKRKRKRKTTTHEATTSPTTKTVRTGGRTNAPAKGGKGKEPASSKEVNSNLRTTLSAINRTPTRKRQNLRKEKRTLRANVRQQQYDQEMADSNILEVTEYLTANELASLMDVSVNEVIGKCMEIGMIVSINQRIDAEVITVIAEEFGFEIKFVSVDEAYGMDAEEPDKPEDLKPRHAIVTVMGHVDHGKTSLLDYIRKTAVTKGEAGGITQHIGAYEVRLPDDKRITFLDTPGHEAFTAMRARGAQVTDIAIIVIAADDQVMPQTREAINHAQAAGVKMVFAINKIDKDGADSERIRGQLSEMNLLVEDWGGTYQCQEISAKKGIGIEELLEKVLLESELLELSANPNRTARGTVIEAELDRGRGAVATLLIQAGTLKVGDIIVANCNYGRVKAMFDDTQTKTKTAGPSTPVQILGLDGVPQAGDKFQVMETDREARELANRRQQLMREQTIRMHKNITLEEIARRTVEGNFQELNVIVKGDVDGSVEALADSLIKLSTPEVAVKIIMKGVGEISESDVLLASASNAIIIGFQVRPSSNARKLIQQESVDLRLYSVIYDAINEIRDALEGLLKPTIEEEVMGAAKVQDIFRIVKTGLIAGCVVTEGKINRTHQVRLIREGIVQYSGKIESLRRFKDDAKEVMEGFECGISIENYNDIKVGDVIESYVSKEIKRTIESTQR